MQKKLSRTQLHAIVHSLGVFVVVGFGVLEGVGEGLAVEGVLTSSHPASCGQSQTSNSLLKWSR
jgi:hypothetical protein